MVYALHSLGSSVPPLPHYPSHPYRGSSSATPTEITPIEEGDSRVSVEGLGYKATYCSLLTSEDNQATSKPVVLIELPGSQVPQTTNPQVFDAEQTKIQDAAIAHLKGVGITARPGGVG